MLVTIKDNLKKFPVLHKTNVKIYNGFQNFLRIKDVLCMILGLFFFKKIVYKFSTRKVLPPEQNKISLSDQITPPYELLKSISSSIPQLDQVTFISSSSSFDLNFLKKIKTPIFLCGFWNSLRLDENENILYLPNPNLTGYNYFNFRLNEKLGKYSDFKKFDELKEYKNPNITYMHSVTTALDYIQSKGHKVLAVIHYLKKKDGEIYQISRNYEKPYFKDYGITDSKSLNQFLKSKKINQLHILERIYKPMEKPYSESAPTAGYLSYISALSFISKKINAYGWDFYLEDSPNNMSSLGLLLRIWNIKMDLKLSKFLFEIGLMNIYYAYKFSKMDKFNIQGRLSELSKHEKLIKKIEKIFYK